MTVDWAAVVNAARPDRAEHPYQLFPALSPDEYAALRQDIEDRGVLVPVEVDESGAILDGHNRAAIAADLGIDYPTVTRPGMTEEDKYDHVFALNMARRHLSGHDRSAVVADLRSRGLSLRAIGRLLRVSHVTVINDLRAEVVSDLPPVVGDSEQVREAPMPPPRSRGDVIHELRGQGRTYRDIAAELGLSESAVYSIVYPPDDPDVRTSRPDTPVEWPQTRALIDAIKEIPNTSPDPRRLAQSVPERNRASVARTLRHVGTYLGSIALELERSDR